LVASYLNVEVYAAFHEWLVEDRSSQGCGMRGKRGIAKRRWRLSPTRSSTI